ncbi:Cytochrome P450 [Penicillium vulpinum]|uniref:Cytochrome P450 n=1 Tax=Penicillium vulpinum TaxID=29845 RepID=UPI0025490A7C|nr:Cytochrome P450 [Penicillium vulpinum]KAJ5970179.1 Cytochrome P450 [Penicillium vulpinum]
MKSRSILLTTFLVLFGMIALFSHGSKAKQFEYWYPFYRYALTQEGDAPTCLQNYTDAVKELGSKHSMTCKNLVSCIYSNTKEIDKADMSSALVLLGLTPTVLGQIGPTINNKAQLWFQNPILGSTLDGFWDAVGKDRTSEAYSAERLRLWGEVAF